VRQQLAASHGCSDGVVSRGAGRERHDAWDTPLTWDIPLNRVGAATTSVPGLPLLAGSGRRSFIKHLNGGSKPIWVLRVAAGILLKAAVIGDGSTTLRVVPAPLPPVQRVKAASHGLTRR